ncbi:hypothetical protein M9H77_28825 [Catharanthus roseus]|uniref:Uncharacterized protein n=1 Tax=Catharanthus roseus TaxID=4058 RepID=A0ACC0AJ33_CATRO|nr:hypothetical protein M9H77_28825 [Catharanthus roseus]
MDGPAVAAKVLSYPSDEYIRWYRGITRVYIGNPANRDTRSHGYQPVGVDRRMMVDRSDGDDVVSSQSESDDDNDPEEGKFQTPLNPVNLVNPITKNIVQQWESSQWFSNARYDYTHSGAFLDMGSGSSIDNLVESGTVRLLDWNDSMTDIQLGMRFVDKVQAVSAVRKNVYTLRLNNKSCSCGKWQTYTLPCSHVLAMCRENGSRTDTYVSEIYSRQMYRRTYQANFHPVLSENFWRMFLLI